VMRVISVDKYGWEMG